MSPEPSPTAQTEISHTPSPSSGPKVTVLANELGYLRVRQEPSADSAEIGQLDIGSTYNVQEESDGWYKIEYQSGQTGWVSGAYVTINQ
jgi:uncharacterized protein YgiM (DUF1202 family)